MPTYRAHGQVGPGQPFLRRPVRLHLVVADDVQPVGRDAVALADLAHQLGAGLQLGLAGRPWSSAGLPFVLDADAPQVHGPQAGVIGGVGFLHALNDAAVHADDVVRR